MARTCNVWNIPVIPCMNGRKNIQAMFTFCSRIKWISQWNDTLNEPNKKNEIQSRSNCRLNWKGSLSHVCTNGSTNNSFIVLSLFPIKICHSCRTDWKARWISRHWCTLLSFIKILTLIFFLSFSSLTSYIFHNLATSVHLSGIQAVAV